MVVFAGNMQLQKIFGKAVDIIYSFTHSFLQQMCQNCSLTLGNKDV